MPTIPIKGVLDRDLAIANAKDIIKIAGPALREAVNYSVNLFGRIQSSISQEKHEDQPIPYLYLHIIEMADGIEVLINNSCSNAAIPQLRSIFESLLYMEYLCKENFEQRALAWVAQYLHSKLDQFDKLDESSKKGVSAKKVFEAELKFIKRPPINQNELHNKIDGIKKILTEPQFVPIENERNRLKKLDKLGRWPNWFQLFGGPSNLGDLASHLSKNSQYDILYRYWSSISHAHDISRFFIKADDSKLYFTKLRDSSDMILIFQLTISWVNEAAILVTQKLRPDEERSLAVWYFNELKPGMDQLKLKSNP